MLIKLLNVKKTSIIEEYTFLCILGSRSTFAELTKCSQQTSKPSTI